MKGINQFLMAVFFLSSMHSPAIADEKHDKLLNLLNNPTQLSKSKELVAAFIAGRRDFTTAEQAELTLQEHEPLIQKKGGAFLVLPGLSRYLQSVGDNIVTKNHLRTQPRYQFVIVNDPIPGAYAIKSQLIIFSRGFFNYVENEAELAFILAHEIAHCELRHYDQNLARKLQLEEGIHYLSENLEKDSLHDDYRQASEVGAKLIASHFRRWTEQEADEQGLQYLIQAGYQPQAARDVLVRLVKLMDGAQRQDWLKNLSSNHPPTAERVKTLGELIANYEEKNPDIKTLDKKETVFNKAIAPFKKIAPAYQYYEQAQRDFERQAYPQAEKKLQAAFRYTKKESLFYLLQGELNNATQQYPDALAQFDITIKLNPSYFDGYLQRGLLHFKLEDKVAAKSDLEMSEGLLPTEKAARVLTALRKNEAL